MRSPLLFVFAVAFVCAGCSRTGTGPLSFASPSDWKVENQTLQGGLHFYTVTARTPDEGLLMFSQWPPPSRPEEIPTLVRQLADGFLKQAQQTSEFTLSSHEYRIDQFSGPGCQGNYAVFQASNGAVQTMFMLSVDGRVWNGQFTGASNTWAKALTVLTSVKKSD